MRRTPAGMEIDEMKRIVVDSSASLYKLDGVDFAAVPLKIVTDEREYLDDGTLNAVEMATTLRTYKGKTSTSCPNIGDWLEAYECADEIYAITITGTLSGSCIRALIEEGRDFDEVCEEMLRYRHHTHLLFSLESLANLARNGRVKPAVAAVARMLNIRVIGKASDVGELDVLCKTRGEHGALERIVLELKGHGYTNGKVIIAHCGNPAAAERLMHMVKAVFEGAQVRVTECGGLCSYYAELGGLMVGFEDADA